MNECVRVLVEICSVNRQRKAFKNQADESKEEKERERARERVTKQINKKKENQTFNNVKDIAIMTILSACNGCHDVCLPEKV